MPQADVIAELQAARARLNAALEGLSTDQMLQPGAVGLWSVKDTLAHLVAWEAELVTVLARIEQHKQRAPRMVEVEDIDEYNAELYHTHVRRDLEDVLQDFAGVHRHLIRAIEDLSAEMLDDNRRWPWMEGEPLSYLIQEYAIWHEEEHAADILAWRGQ